MASSVSSMPMPVLARDLDGVGGVDADDVLDLFGHAVGLGGGQVDLVEDRHDLVVGVDGLIDIGQRLRLDPLGAVHHQQRAFDRAHGAGDLIGEIHMARRVDQVEHVGLTVLCAVFDAHGVGLDRDAALALDIHGVEQLFLHVPVGHRIGGLNEPVGKGGFPVVDMGDDGEIADLGELCHARGYAVKRGYRQCAADRAERFSRRMRHSVAWCAEKALKGGAAPSAFSLTPGVFGTRRRDPTQKKRFSATKDTTRNSTVMTPPARTKSTTRYPAGPMISALT